MELFLTIIIIFYFFIVKFVNKSKTVKKIKSFFAFLSFSRISDLSLQNEVVKITEMSLYPSKMIQENHKLQSIVVIATINHFLRKGV